ncbi:MAG: hypothetical protein J0H74_02530 [Chitinophagaceae bacterium]|nr:hypothetical protein [Chitinophagaceae bacterium]
MKEKELSGQESLQLITQMINRAKNDYIETGVSALMWGAIITFCALVTFVNVSFLRYDWLNAVWLLTFIAIIPQIVIARRERKQRKHKGHDDRLIGGIWLSFAVAMILTNYIDIRWGLNMPVPLYLTLYGVPTFTIGYGRKFRFMIVGGVACWVFAILSSLTPSPWQILYLAGGAQLAWFIPGLILRKRYLKERQKNV